MEPEETVLLGPTGEPFETVAGETPAPLEEAPKEDAGETPAPTRKVRLRGKKKDDAPRVVVPWRVSSWAGRENYECLGCEFKTLSADAIAAHVVECNALKGGRS